ncbi:MAG: hypothetical protein WCS94_25750, partial [Verrucomicrobiota bacterium]
MKNANDWVDAEKSDGGPPQSKTLARCPMAPEPRAASWTAPALWRFGEGNRAFAIRETARRQSFPNSRFLNFELATAP